MTSLSFSVPPGRTGAVIVNARTNRRSGTAQKCCTRGDNSCPPDTLGFQQTDYWNVDQKFEGQYGFVEGWYRICDSDRYPIPYCIGSGTLK
jgi:hypothetical protein